MINRDVYLQFAVFIFSSLLAVSASAQGVTPSTDDYVQRTEVLTSQVLNEERTVTVQLPKSYFKNPNRRYPVIYRLDGKGNLPFMTAVIERLHDADTPAAPEVIIVAIENTDRLRDFYPTKNEEPAGPVGIGGGAPKFLKFIATELIPFVNKEYRTHDYKVIAGSSAGGVFVLYALQANPDLFQAHIAYSPAVWWNYGASVKAVKGFFSQKNKLDSYLYMNIGEEGGVMRERYDDMRAFLNTHQPEGFTFISETFEKVPHGLTSGAGAFNAYQKLFLPFRMPNSAYDGETNSISAYYKKLSNQYGKEILPLEWVVRELGYHHVNMGDLEEAIKIFKFNVSLHPNVADAYNGLAFGYERKEMYEESLVQVNKALSLSDEGYDGYDVYLARKGRLTKVLQK